MPFNKTSKIIGSYAYTPRNININGDKVMVVNPFQYRRPSMGLQTTPVSQEDVYKYRLDSPYHNASAADRRDDNPPTTPDQIMNGILPNVQTRNLEQSPNTSKGGKG